MVSLHRPLQQRQVLLILQKVFSAARRWWMASLGVDGRVHQQLVRVRVDPNPVLVRSVYRFRVQGLWFQVEGLGLGFRV